MRLVTRVFVYSHSVPNDQNGHNATMHPANGHQIDAVRLARQETVSRRPLTIEWLICDPNDHSRQPFQTILPDESLEQGRNASQILHSLSPSVLIDAVNCRRCVFLVLVRYFGDSPLSDIAPIPGTRNVYNLHRQLVHTRGTRGKIPR